MTSKPTSEIEFFAHTPNNGGRWHELSNHLQSVAAQAREFAEPLGAPEVGYLLGLWHDVGKCAPLFQQYLQDAHSGQARRRGPDHKGAGALLAAKHLGPAAMAIQGHHGGLRSLNDFRAWVQERGEDPAVAEAMRLAHGRVGIPLEPNMLPVAPGFVDGKLPAEFWVRLLFSALVDADFLDTEAHFKAETAAVRGSAVGMVELWRRFEEDQAMLQADATPSEVNVVRQDVYQACLAAADRDPGLFRLAVPTGGGKTRSAMAFALRHAVRNQQRQVIVAVPFITITQQTAGVYRDIFAPLGNDVMLEHHSGSTREDDADDYESDVVWRRLAAENWDAPVVVTTTVQLFESLFSNRVSACRKLHRLANSVIVLDEAQALPPHLLEPILDGLRELVDHYHTSVVISTATQPAFEAIRPFRDLAATDIVPDAHRHFETLRRVDYDWRIDRTLSWPEVADLMRDASADGRQEPRQALAVVNTKRDVLAMLDALADDSALHLSTLLRGAHRNAVLAEVKRRLAAKEPCLLVATQVVEAGVDIDFPLVLRAMGPFDSIIQAAGRCNREGKMLTERGRLGRVIVFRPAEGGMPQGAYRAGTQETEVSLAAGDRDPDNPDAVARYFRRLYQDVALDREAVQPKRLELDYPEVAQRFRMIDYDSMTVVVLGYPGPEQNAAINGMLDELRERPESGRAILRQVRPFTVAVRRRVAERLIADGRMGVALNGAIGVWAGEYDRVRGIMLSGDPFGDAVA